MPQNTLIRSSRPSKMVSSTGGKLEGFMRRVAPIFALCVAVAHGPTEAAESAFRKASKAYRKGDYATALAGHSMARSLQHRRQNGDYVLVVDDDEIRKGLIVRHGCIGSSRVGTNFHFRKTIKYEA